MTPNWLTAYLAPYQSVQRNGATLDELVGAHLPEEHLAGLTRLGFLILRPDSLLHDEAADILDYLQDDYGIFPVAMRVLHVRPYLFDALYRFKLQFFRDNVWLHQNIFQRNPAAVLLVAGSTSDQRSLSEYLNDLKGPSLAVQNIPATLRTQFTRVSSFHAVVHASEDPGALVYESTLFFPWNDLRAMLARLASQEDAVSHLALRKIYRRTLLDVTPKHVSVFQTLLHLKQRILAALLLRASTSNLSELHALWELTRMAIRQLDQQSYIQQRGDFLAFARAERASLQELIAQYENSLQTNIFHSVEGMLPRCAPEDRWRMLDDTLAPLHLLYASWYLSGHDVYTLDDGLALFTTLANNNIPLSDWQQTIVQSGLRSDINYDATWAGEPLFPY